VEGPAVDAPPTVRFRPRLDPISGGSRAGGALWRSTYWLLPATVDDMTFFAAWPARGVPHGEIMFTATELRTARDAVQRLDW
jgi:hypothetical protein